MIYFDLVFFVTAAATFSWTNAREIYPFVLNYGNPAGRALININTNTLQLQTASVVDSSYINDDGTVDSLQADDYSFCMELLINF